MLSRQVRSAIVEFIVASIFMCGAAALGPLPCRAQIIEGKSAPVLIKASERSAKPLTLEKSDEKRTVVRQAYMLAVAPESLPAGASTFDALPVCALRHTRIQALVKHELVSDKLDIVVYQNGNSDQKREARQTGSKAVPYLEGDSFNPFRDKVDKTQELLRTLDLHCVPTRVRVIVRDKEQKLEYREGEAAVTALGH